MGTAIGGALVVGPGYQAAGLFGAAILVLSLVITLIARPALREAIAS